MSSPKKTQSYQPHKNTVWIITKSHWGQCLGSSKWTIFFFFHNVATRLFLRPLGLCWITDFSSWTISTDGSGLRFAGTARARAPLILKRRSGRDVRTGGGRPTASYIISVSEMLLSLPARERGVSEHIVVPSRLEVPELFLAWYSLSGAFVPLFSGVVIISEGVTCNLS